MIDRAENIRLLKQAAEEKQPRKQLINRVSQKRKIEDAVYLKIREAFLKKHKVCEAKVECRGNKATQVHHKKGRVGKNYLDENSWISVCMKCHVWIELNPRHAKKLLLSKSRLVK